jgi:hypothetical protein
MTAELVPAFNERVQERITPRSRPGRRFTPVAERELHPTLRNLAARLPRAANGVVVIAEMPGPTGLPDLVAIPVTARLGIRLNYPCPPLLAWSDARLAAACSTARPLSLETLARRLGDDIHNTRRRARRLSRIGALIEDRAGFLRPRELEPVGRLYALEAKVDDWSSGLGQALRYGAWADASGAVMGQLPRDHSDPVRLASQLGLGLALGARWLVRPRVRRLALAKRLWASEFAVAALGLSDQSPNMYK